MISPATGDGRHTLHSGARIWPESNCYVDLWVGLLHARGLDPVAMLLCALDSRFEIDQWTFCKPTASELASLYGVRVEELNLWWNTRAHVKRQVAAGRVVLLETDGFFLPDTAATTYQRAHGKTTIGIFRLDVDRRELHYLHNAGVYSLCDDDFDGVFAAGVTAAALPPFAEFVDLSDELALNDVTLRERAGTLARQRLARDAARDPFAIWSDYAAAQLDELAARELDFFHAWAFATVRQAGSMADLLAHWCRWMNPGEAWRHAATLCDEVAQAMAAQQFRLARVPGGGRRPDLSVALARCAPLWADAHAIIRAGVASLEGVERRMPPASSTRLIGY